MDASAVIKPGRLWIPSLGACPEPGGTRFRLWAPTSASVIWIGGHDRILMEREGDGYFSLKIPGAPAGTRYRYEVDGKGPFPDPCSRWQPEGVHGPSAVVDPAAFAWADGAWPGLPAQGLSLYELHVGTFTPEGTFRAAAAKLPYLSDLGVAAIEIMPVADFPGERNWGYDGVALFAPARVYGTPEDFRFLVNEAHRRGLGVLLDVVYNHLGPDGNYTGAFSPYYFTGRHSSPWGAGVNLDGEQSAEVRRFFLENALHWVHEYHIDGLRLDATHAIIDDSARPFLAEVTERVHAAVPGRRTLVIAEDHRNLASMVLPAARGGWDMDGVWADDFHHEVRRLLAGDHEGYYEDYAGATENIATAIRQGWTFTGQHSRHLKKARGTDPEGVPYERFVFFIQNHDQVGNRAKGERLHHEIDAAAYRAATALWLFSPETPLLFMGQEWGTQAPFLFFTDHSKELGALVTQGRRREFEKFSAFAGSGAQASIPDPQAESTFADSRLRWNELDKPEHAALRRLYQALLGFRKSEPAWKHSERSQLDARALGSDAVAVRRQGPADFLLVARLRGQGDVDVPAGWLDANAGWSTALTTEDGPYAGPSGAPPVLTGNRVRFARPSALFLRKGL